MITRSRAKMATNNNNSESREFDVNNELNIEGREENATPSDDVSACESEIRAGGQVSQPGEMNLQTLFEFLKQRDEKMTEKLDQQNNDLEKMQEEQNQQNKKLEQHNEKQNKLMTEKLEQQSKELSEKQDKTREELKLSLIHI